MLLVRNNVIRKYIDICLVFIALMIGTYLNLNIVESLIFTLMIWTILNPLPGKYFAYAALFFLSVTPFLLVLDRKVQAEEYAIYAYYFLVLTVIMGIYEMRHKKNEIIID
ncbi:MAG: hypothetical protein US63_C0004G0004 [Candidatus Moranbacteria bacterium GW2011_GWC2_37_8]|nr:MAG: hypothetical protein US63_C0004G0004 [Candidatus Moranbacteria bacterium GW2011_GWC2_37_8]KKQ62554.1 MAG: hypothetical protein US82_C0009G0004 [Parcubacteria group bacterium GW2011_GWC1_38_22]